MRTILGFCGVLALAVPALATEQCPESGAVLAATGGEHAGSQHPCTWGGRCNKFVVGSAAEHDCDAGRDIGRNDVLREYHDGSAKHDRDGSGERDELLLLLPRGEYR